MDYRDIITFSLYIATFVNPIRKMATLSEMLANGFAGLNRFTEIMRTDPSVQDAPDARELSSVRGNISVRHVDFGYHSELPVLKDVNLDVKAGETIAVVGPSGGGKTTLCQLIPRFYDVSGGEILIDGKDVRSVTQRSLRSNIGIVQQDVFLFADTVFENIRYGKPDASMEEVVDAAKRAVIYDDIMAMPNGFDTYVGERGTLLSGGQKQRISIARIFLKNPPILILDEATSALDNTTEILIQQALDELCKGRTTLVVAHRLSTIKNADEIAVVDDGRIVEQGSHEQLMAKGGIYRDLYELQFRANVGAD
jgi:ATP-binding cassette subfamily B protein